MAVEDLNYRQRRFVNAYLGEANGNATEAARLVGYRNPAEYGHQLLQKTSVRAAIAARVAQESLPADEVLGRLADQARGDMGDFLSITEKGVTIDLQKAKRRGRLALIKKFSLNRFGIVLELYDAQDALVQLGKYHGLLDPIELGDETDETLRTRAPIAD